MLLLYLTTSRMNFVTSSRHHKPQDGHLQPCSCWEVPKVLGGLSEYLRFSTSWCIPVVKKEPQKRGGPVYSTQMKTFSLRERKLKYLRKFKYIDI